MHRSKTSSSVEVLSIGRSIKLSHFVGTVRWYRSSCSYFAPATHYKLVALAGKRGNYSRIRNFNYGI